MIRRMLSQDVHAVRDIDAEAFGAWRRQLSGDWSRIPKRTCVNVLLNMEKDPEGCFVAEVNGEVVGFIFSRTWGGVGWFGTFAVLPAYQGRKIGQQLIAASMAYLRQEPNRVIGLETMPESTYNLGLYLRRGFQVCLLTMLMSKSLDPSGPKASSLLCWSSAEPEAQARYLADLRVTTGQILPGLDYTKEIVAVARHAQGDTLVLCDGERAVGMSTVNLVDARKGNTYEWATIDLLALHPDYTDEETFGQLLNASEAMACAHGKQELLVPVVAGHPWVVDQLITRGYRVERAIVRMLLSGTPVEPFFARHVNLSRWAG